MPTCINNCGLPLIEQEVIDCNDYKLGDIRSVGLIFCKDMYDTIINPDATSPAPWLAPSVTVDDLLILNNLTAETTRTPIEKENPVANGVDNYSYGVNYTIAKEVMPYYVKPFGFIFVGQ